MADAMSKAISTVNRATRSGTKAFVGALPLISVGGNVLQAYTANPTNPTGMINRIVRNYTGYDFQAGRFDTNALMSGTGTLIISSVASKIIKSLL